MAEESETRIQLCGRLVVKLAGRRLEEALPGRQGRLLFAYLASHRRRPATRSELLEAVWPEGLPAAPDAALNALVAKLRQALGADVLAGRREIELALPPGAWIDLEAASESLHRAESAVALGDWARAWGPARVALHIAMREFLPGHEGPWTDEIRRRLGEIFVLANECVATAGLALGGPELASAERSARALVAAAPFRESGYRFQMDVLARRGNVAEALLVYERLRMLLREELGASPSPETQALHRRLLGGDGAALPGGRRELASILFTDIVGSTEILAALGDRAWRDLVDRHHAAVRAELARHGGREVDVAGDGFLATFERPADAIACGCQIARRVRGLGLEIRAGIHTGEVEVIGERVSGIAVHIGSRVVASAGPGEVLVSSTVKDLVVGSGIEFEDRGFHELKGLPGEWRLFTVRPESVPAAATA